MEVILLERIRNLGSLGQTVKVKRGYGRNYLVPYGKAVYATKENIQKFEARRAELEKLEAEHLKAAEVRKENLLKIESVTILSKAGEEGKLFGSIGTRDIAEAITAAGAQVEKSEVHLPLGALRHVGEYEVEIEFHSDVRAMIKVHIAAEETH